MGQQGKHGAPDALPRGRSAEVGQASERRIALQVVG